VPQNQHLALGRAMPLSATCSRSFNPARMAAWLAEVSFRQQVLGQR
jgi:hypothetical protein